LFGEFFYNKMKRGDQKIFHQKALVSVTRVTFHSCAQCRNGVDEIFSSSIERNSLSLSPIGDVVIHTVVCVSPNILCDMPDDTIILLFPF
jgi:hypothetical protein